MYSFHKLGRSILAMVLCVSMVFGMSATGLAITVKDGNGDGKINYVSIGDSMTNGYCFDGYEQGNSDTEKLDFLNGKGVYGNGAYPLQFEEWLKEEGYEVNHTKLAPSAMRAEDLNYLLGGREMPTDGWYPEVNGYTEVYNNETLSQFFTDAVKDADIITMGIGNASFGAYLLHRVTDAIGVFDATLAEERKVNLEMALEELDPKEKAAIVQIYDDLMAQLKAYIPDEMEQTYSIDDVCDLVAYTAASFLMNYKGSLERIVELNPDVEIILIGLINTTYGMNITVDGMDPIPVGDIMDGVFGALNAYIAGLPAVMQTSGEWQDAKFYYAENMETKFISQQFANLKKVNWGNIDCSDDTCVECLDVTNCADGRLSGAIVRDRNIDAYNGALREKISEAFRTTLPPIDIEAVEKHEVNDPEDEHNCTDNLCAASVAVYLGIEDAVAASTDTMDIPLSGLIKIAGNLSEVFVNAGIDLAGDVRKQLADYLTSTDELKGMCKIYALFKVGNGMSVHPTPSGHDDMFDAIVKAYTEGNTVQNQTIANLIGYVNDAFKYAIDNVDVEALHGYIDSAEYAVEQIRNAVDADTELDEDLRKALIDELDAILGTLGEIDGIIDNIVKNDLDLNGAWDEILTLEDDLNTHYDNLAAIADEVIEIASPEVQKALAELDEILNTVNYYADLVSDIASDAYDYAVNTGKEFAEAYAAFVEYAGEAADLIDPELGAAVRKFLTETPADTISILYAYGKDAVTVLFAEAAAASGEVYTILANLVDVLAGEAEAIIGAVKNNAEVQVLLAEISEKKIEIEALVEEIKNYPVSSALAFEKEAALNTLKTELTDLYEALYNAVYSVIDDNSGRVANAIDISIEALSTALAVVTGTGSDYAEWLPEHAEAMAGALYAALIANVDEFTAVAVPILKAWIADGIENVKETIQSIADYLEENDDEIIACLTDAAKKLAAKALNELYDLIVEYYPVAADWVYDYLYNNPEKVIAFINEYADDIFALAEEYSEEIFMVIGYLAMNYGDEVVAFIMENHTEILAAMCEWWQIHGDNTIALMQVYAEALGLCDAVREQIEALENAIDEIEDAVNAKIAEIEAQIKALEEQLKTAVGEAKAEIEAKIAELKAEIEALKATVAAKIAEVEAAIENLKAELEKAIAEGLRDLEAVKDALANLDEKVEELIEAAENAALDMIDEALADVQKAIAKLDAALAELGGEIYEELKAALAELTKDVIEYIYDAVKEYAPEIADAIYDYLYNNSDEVIDFFKEYSDEIKELVEKYGTEVLAVIAYILYETGEELVAYLIENGEEILAAMSEWWAIHGENTIALIKVYVEALGLDISDDIREALADLADLITEIGEKIIDGVISSEEFQALVAGVQKVLAEIKEEAIAISIELAAEVEKIANEINDALSELFDALYAMYLDGTHGEYEVKGDSFYVSIGDSGVTGYGLPEYGDKYGYKGLVSDSFPVLLADALGLDLNKQFIQLGQGGFRAEDILYILDENYVPDDFAIKYTEENMNKFDGGLENYRKTYRENLEKADLVTVGIGGNNVATFYGEQLKKMMMGAKPYEMDWANLVGEEGAVQVAKALELLRAELVAQGLPESTNLMGMEMDLVELITFSVECLMYGYVGYAVSYVQVVDAIHEISPDAHVILVGYYNPIDDLDIVLDEATGTSVPLGDLAELAVNAAGLEALIYAMLNADDTTFVATPDVETFLDAMIANGEIEATAATYLYAMIQDTYLTHANEVGHEYIKDQILNAMDITLHECVTVSHDEVPATCLEDGMEAYSECTECFRIYDAEGNLIDSLDDLVIKAKGEHIFTNYVSDGNATCHMDGTKTAICDNDGCSETHTIADEGSKLTHSFTNYVPDGNATCTMDGTKTAKCDNGCGTGHTVEDPGSVLYHSFTDFTVVTEATCTEAGSKVSTCARCKDATRTMEIPATGHTFKDYVDDGNLDCDVDGTKTAVCEDCDATDTVVVTPATGHNPVGGWVSGDTQHWHECEDENCDDLLDAAGHTPGDFDVVEYATVYNYGLIGYFCDVCDSYYKTDDEIEYRLGNTYNDDVINVKDVVLMIQYCAGYELPESVDMFMFKLTGDVDGSDKVTLKDVVYVIRHIAGFKNAPLA